MTQNSELRTQNSAWMSIGRIAGSFGVRGEMKVDLLTDFPERFSGLETVFVGDDREPYQIERTRPHKEQVVLKLRQVDTPEAVRELSGQDIAVPREEAVELGRGEYFLDDLVGIRVDTDTGDEVGKITEVLRTGSNDVYVVRAGKAEVLVPGTSQVVIELNLEQRRMVIESWILESDQDEI